MTPVVWIITFMKLETLAQMLWELAIKKEKPINCGEGSWCDGKAQRASKAPHDASPCETPFVPTNHRARGFWKL